MTDGPDGPERIGSLLVRLRLARGLSQLRVAERLCDASGMPTVSRHEVSRWEREDRVPGSFWLGWLAVVLDAPLEQLEAAIATFRGRPSDTASHPDTAHQLWRPPTAPDLLAALDNARIGDIRSLAHAWLAGPPDPPPNGPHNAGWTSDPGDGTARDLLDAQEAQLGRLRRVDDLVGGLDLTGHIDRGLRDSIQALRKIGRAGDLRRRLLRVVAGYAQLAGWVHHDAGNNPAARRAYQVALQAAAAGEDRLLAAHVLGSLSYQSLAAGNPAEAMLLTRTGLAGIRANGCALLRVLLLHRVALAAAHSGHRSEAEVALAGAERAADRCPPEPEPGWLYWLEETELTAMTGRCLAMLGRPLRAVSLLARQRTNIGPRTMALYQVWLARTHLNLGEVEQACHVAGQTLALAVSTGSVRAAEAMRHLHPLLLRHRDVPAVRDYEQQAAQASKRLPVGGAAHQRTGAHGTTRTSTTGRRPPSSRTTATAVTTTPAPAPHRTPQAAQQRIPAPATTAGRPASMPMGIRYKSGPGVRDTEPARTPRQAPIQNQKGRKPGTAAMNRSIRSLGARPHGRTGTGLPSAADASGPAGYRSRS
jgi:transcriptional regulator with XRE-family HTH domain